MMEATGQTIIGRRVIFHDLPADAILQSDSCYISRRVHSFVGRYINHKSYTVLETLGGYSKAILFACLAYKI
jgi:hypothetical protein